eukprot:CAMPEP_0174945464 /NCGR_PEP_ID=MMETSP1355-20121228/81724_1 /TAXON_ID=464990 /ORGANISM="Hemiselmis tepida, Strain CCMP443" /LENGTH=149 /DNA_ID=CAMNT_0016192843 /DNA_START=176 /DNA_END=621 /DNA_ORIENTATION=-
MAATQVATTKGKMNPIFKSQTSSMDHLDNTGGIVQQEFSAAEERTELSIMCLSALRRMHEGKEADQARELLDRELGKLKSDPVKYAEGCCVVSELLNRWGSACQSYSPPMMEAAVHYAEESIGVFEKMGKGGRCATIETALFWKALNAA